MKVIRLRNGYSVRCTSSEFEALTAMALAGRDLATDKKKHSHLSRGAKGAIRKAQFQSPAGPLEVTQDRSTGADADEDAAA